MSSGLAEAFGRSPRARIRRDADPVSDEPQPDILRGGIAAGLFFIGFAGWAAMIPLDAAVVARGVVVVAGNRQTVQHLDGGIVRALYAKEGDQVEAGQILVELDDTQLLGQERALSSRLIELEALRARILAENSGDSRITPPERWAALNPADRGYADSVLNRQARELKARSGSAGSRVVVLRQRRLELEARLPGQQQEMDATGEQLRLLDDEISGLQDLKERGLATVGRLRALERERASLAGRMGRLASEMSQTRESINETRGEIASLTAALGADRAKELSEVEGQLAEASPRHEAIVAQLGRTRIRAPASGEVVGLTAFTVGGVIEPGARVMDIVPVGRDLVVEASVAPESADDVRPDSRAEIRLSGLHGRNLPKLWGTVSKVSADRLVDAKTGAGYFRIEVEVAAGELDKLAEAGSGPTKEIRPGIPAEVIIPTRKRTALQYVLEPLSGALWSSFRED